MAWQSDRVVSAEIITLITRAALDEAIEDDC
jgi:hypothetical protein